MSFFFRNYPFVEYDSQKNGVTQIAQNPLLRLRLVPLIKNNKWVFYEHIIQDGQRAEDIAFNYYEDETLDWVVYLTNDIIDPKYDWPLPYIQFQNFIISKYGSLSAAASEVSTTNIHAYEWIVRNQSVNVDGTIIPEKYIVVDETTYLTLLPAERRTIRKYEYENRLNETKRSIKLLKKSFVRQFVNEARALITS
jgi:hypothetical protein